MKPETAILKDSLTHAALAEIKDIRLPALTDEPTKLVSFITGLRYFYTGNFEKAVEYFTYSLPEQFNKYIDSSSILFNRGHSYLFMKQYDKAIADFSQAISLNPKKYEAYGNRGVSYSAKGKYDKAIDDYNQVIFLNPKDEQAYNNRANNYLYKGEYDKAIADYTQAISLNPKDDKAYNNRGIDYSDKGEYDKAIADYTQAISLNPKDYNAYYNRGNAYGFKGGYDKAIADYSQAIALNPKYDAAYSNRGNIYGIKYDKAIVDYTQAISLNPKEHKIYFIRGVAYEIQRMYDKAIEDFNQAIKNIPQFSKFTEPYNSMSRLLATCSDDKYRDGNKAIEFAQKALESEPNNPAILDTLAAAYAEAGKFEDAVKTQEKAISLLSEKDKDKYLSEYTEHLNFYKARKPWREKPRQKSNVD
jgi:tetratricopeptide (TPR) repeat protein